MFKSINKLSSITKRSLFRPNNRFLSTKSTFISSPTTRNYLRYVLLGVGLTTGLAGFAGLDGGNNFITSIKSDEKTINNESIGILKGVDPIPILINSPLSTTFQLIGYGIREVSFLKFKVYALGLYISQNDLENVSKILDSKFLENFYDNNLKDHKSNLENALKDPKLSTVLIENLLISGVKFTARICAARNTDLSHLRDGFIRTIKNGNKYKELMKNEDDANNFPQRIEAGLAEIQTIFNNKKMSAPKNSLIYMEIIEDGKIKVNVEIYDKKSLKHKKPIEIGVINEPLVSELLFLSYLANDKPLVQEVHDRAAESFISIA